MANAIQQLRGGLTVGYAALGLRGENGQQGSVRQQVTDGDTVSARTTGNIGVRLLGVDAPEIGYSLPTFGEERGGYERLSDPRWERFFSDPFAGRLEPFEPPLDEGLIGHLRPRLGPGAAENHYEHAQAAEDALEEAILKDIEALGQTEEDFEFFLAFSYEVMDGFGRFLCFLNRRQPNEREPEPRPKSYNERLLAAGRTSPSFIWPNVSPFRRAGTVVEAVIPPGEAARTAGEDASLRSAREGVKEARRAGVGVYDAADPLRLEPFEVRFLASRRPPDRWVVDLGKDDDALTPPQRYYTVPDPEDRLFLPEEFVPLFVEAGWRRG